MRKGYGALFALFVAFSMMGGGNSGSASRGREGLHAGGGQASGAAAPSAVESDFASALKARCDASDAKKPLCEGCGAYCPAQDLLDTMEAQFGKSGEWPTEAAANKHWNVPGAESPRIQFLIATLPDPVHTHLALGFDRSIEAISKAVQASGYYFSRATMPWDVNEHGDSSDLRVRKIQSEYQDQREDFPGLMIFKKSKSAAGAGTDDSAYLFALVVTETPTGGIHKQQFQNALRMMEEIQGNASERTLYILGTTFSGSLGSLEDVLSNDPRAQKIKNVIVRSGNTTSWGATCEFGQYLKKKDEEDFEKRADKLSGEKFGEEKRTRSFVTFQESDDFALVKFREFIGLHGYKPEQLAILSEDETAYGGRPTVSPEQKGDDHPPCFYAESSEDKKILRLFFPREISQLRAAYQRDLLSQTSTDPTKQAPRTTLPLNLDPTGSDDDSVATFAKLQTPLSQESVLLSIVANLRKHHSQYIIVRATDSLDALFLCEFLRTAYPEGRLATMGTDLIFQRESDTSQLHGVMAISTYPLLPGIDDLELRMESAGGETDHVDQVFPESYSAGVYNAVLSLLVAENNPSGANVQKNGLVKIPGEVKSGVPFADYEQYGWPQLAGEKSAPEPRPAVWLTALGRSGYWPVALLDQVSDPSTDEPSGTYQLRNLLLSASPNTAVKPSAAEIYKIPFPVPWNILWIFSFALLCCYSGMMAFPPPRSSEATANFALAQDSLRNMHLFVIGVLQLSIQLLFLYPGAVWGFQFRGTGWLIVPPLLGIFILAVGGCKGLRMRGSPTLSMAFAGCTAATLVIFLSLGVNWGEEIQTAEASFAAYRYVHLGSGVSPFVPLLLIFAGGLWSGWYSLAGTFLIGKRGPALPEASDFKRRSSLPKTECMRLGSVCRERNATLQKLLGPFSWDLRVYVPTIFALLGAIYILHFNEATNVLEGAAYRHLFSALFFVSVGLLLVLTFRIVVIWVEFHKLLRALENLPLRRSFDLLKGYAWKPLWKLAGSTGVMDFYRLVAREVETLQQLKNSGPGDEMVLDEIKDVNECLDEICGLARPEGDEKNIVEATRKLEEELESKMEELHAKLATTSAATLEYLATKWKEEEYTPEAEASSQAPAAEGEEKIPKMDARTAGAERFVCLFFLNYILVVLRRVQTIILSIAGVFVFILMALNSYPFEPHLTLRTMLIFLFFLILGCVGFVYAQMYKDATLSRITDTKPGELGAEFYVRMAGFIVVPLLSLVAAQFPTVNTFLFSWLEPAMQALK